MHRWALADLDRDALGLLVVVVAHELGEALVDGHAGAPQAGDEDRHRLRAELLERPVAVLAHAEVDLRDGVDAERWRRGR